MTVELERALRRKCAEDERVGMLIAQWEYDKRLVSQALQTVGYNFPHYSRHDASHSDNILLQVTRVLGARIDQLSATDLWLLLEAAYWHDSGMIVDAETASTWWRSNDFKRHLEKLRDGSDPMLLAAARLVDAQLPIKSELWPLEVRKAVTLVLADFGREHHAVRSGAAVLHPLLQGIKSPRALIPQRLYAWLAEIAVRHGQSIDLVMELPYVEGGLGTEVCHPRFVAFMLRLGDLLDLDNGRFCDVMTRAFGTLPISSQDHVGKHAAISHFSVSPERVEVTATCRTEGRSESGEESSDPYGAYEAVSSWLEWLKVELLHLASNWSTIAPPNFGAAPSLGTIQTVLEGYLSFENGKRPKFSVDEAAFIRLVRSNNLYKSSFAWVRELLANAEDATLIRVHQDPERALPEPDSQSSSPFEKVRETLSDYPIEVTLERRGEQLAVEIKDQGTGISAQDLRYMLSIGSSQLNPERRRLRASMPVYAAPTGSFGIGLQSVFMATSELVIRTRHAFSGDALEIKVRRERNTDDVKSLLQEMRVRAGVYVKKLSEDSHRVRPGTIVSFTIEQAELSTAQPPAPETTEQGNRPPPYLDDPIQRERSSGDRDRLIAEFERMAGELLATVKLNGNVLPRPDPKEEERVFDGDTSTLFAFRDPKPLMNPLRTLYRGADVGSASLPALPILDLALDLRFGRASELVMASREALTQEGSQKVLESIRAGLPRALETYVQRIEAKADATASAPDSKRALLALFAHLYLSVPPRALNTVSGWHALSVVPGGPALDELVGDDVLGLLDPSWQTYATENRSLEVSSAAWKVLPTSPFPVPIIRDVLARAYPDAVVLSYSPEGTRYRFQRGSGAVPTLDAATFPEATVGAAGAPVGLFQQLSNSLNALQVGYSTRVIWPELAEYKNLRVDTFGNPYVESDADPLPPWVREHKWLVRRVTVLPLEFRFEVELPPRVSVRHIGGYLRWVHEHCWVADEAKRDDPRRPEAIRAETERLITSLVEELGKRPPLLDFDGNAFSLAEALSQLKLAHEELKEEHRRRAEGRGTPQA